MSSPTISAPGVSPSRADVWKMFDRIAHRYDRLNRMLSFGTDVRWRKRMAKSLTQRLNQRVLDLATGTGDQIISLLEESDRIEDIVGVDLSENMLAIGRDKLKSRFPKKSIAMKRGDAVEIPEENDRFDAVTMSFGIRNVTSVEEAMMEMLRVLNKGGRALILEFSIPRNRVVRWGYLFYLRHILPRIGGIISGDAQAYRYLNETIETFPYGLQFCSLMEKAGFQNVEATPLTFGVATIYQGEKP